MIDPTLEAELALLAEGYRLIAGVDEVGRGSWAGPVVAAAVILPIADPRTSRALAGVRDSKQLTPRRREQLFSTILNVGEGVGVGWASHHVVDSIGIAAANRRAMLRAVRNLPITPDVLLLDYFRLPESSLPQVSLTCGDSRSLSIAAASVVAKVVRDRWMTRCDSRFPGYGFASHKGYGTPVHRSALAEHGPCALHRRSFGPVLDQG